MNQCSVPTRNQQLLYTRFLLQKGRQNVTLHLGIMVNVCDHCISGHLQYVRLKLTYLCKYREMLHIFYKYFDLC